MKKPIEAKEPMVVFARMDRLSKVQRSIYTLVKYGYMSDCGDGKAEITQAGVDMIYLLARKYKLSAHDNDD